MQRDLIKFMEGISLHNDYTVGDKKNGVVQIVNDDDSIESSKLCSVNEKIEGYIRRRNASTHRKYR